MFSVRNFRLLYSAALFLVPFQSSRFVRQPNCSNVRVHKILPRNDLQWCDRPADFHVSQSASRERTWAHNIHGLTKRHFGDAPRMSTITSVMFLDRQRDQSSGNWLAFQTCCTRKQVGKIHEILGKTQALGEQSQWHFAIQFQMHCP